MSLFRRLTEKVDEIKTDTSKRLDETPYNLLRRVDELERWRHSQADPKIKNNMESIVVMVSDIENRVMPNIQMNTEYARALQMKLEKEVLPAMNENLKIVSRFQEQLDREIVPKLQQALTMSQEAISLGSQANTRAKAVNDKVTVATNDASALLAKAKGLTDLADEAVGKAKEGINRINELILKLRNAGTNLRKDGLKIKYGAGDMLGTIRKEMERIVDAFKMLGDNVAGAAMGVKNEAVDIGNALKETYNGLSTSLGRSKIYIDKVKDPNIVDLAFVFYNIFMALGHLSFMNYGGYGGAFEEVIKGFQRLSTEFRELGAVFSNFGNRMKVDAPAVHGIINSAMNNIGIAINDFLNLFQSLSVNLAEAIS